METSIVKIVITLTIKGNRVLANVASDDVSLDQKQAQAISDVVIAQLVEEK